jgi:hypothetical protein
MAYRSIFMLNQVPHTSWYIMLFKLLQSVILVKSYKLICKLGKKVAGAFFCRP